MLIYEENGDTYINGEPEDAQVGMECPTCGHIEMIETLPDHVTIEGNLLFQTKEPLPLKGDGRNQISFYECPICGHPTICIEEGGDEDGLLEVDTQHTTEGQAERVDRGTHHLQGQGTGSPAGIR